MAEANLSSPHTMIDAANGTDELDISSDSPATPTPLPSMSSAARSAASTPLSRRLVVVQPDAAGVSVLIERVMDQCGLTQGELARRLGVTKQAVSQYKYFKRANPSVVTLAKLCLAAGGRLLVELPSRAR